MNFRVRKFRSFLVDSLTLDIDTTTEAYKNKKDIYTAKATLSDGTVYDFGAGAYEPHHEQNTVVWDNAQHHVSDLS